MNLQKFKPNNKNTFVSRYQTTGEIAGAIVKAIDESKPTANELKKFFENSNPKTSAKLIFIFCKNAVPYNKEPGTRQTAKTVNRILWDAKKHGGDCKHYATLCASLCKALNIPVKLRLISQRHDTKQPNHIYAVAIIDGKEVIIDPVLKTFDTEARYDHKFDINL